MISLSKSIKKSIENLMPRRRKDLTRKFTACAICSIGVGTSIQQGEEYTHQSKVCKAEVKGKEFILCEECYERKDTKKLERLLRKV